LDVTDALKSDAMPYRYGEASLSQQACAISSEHGWRFSYEWWWRIWWI